MRPVRTFLIAALAAASTLATLGAGPAFAADAVTAPTAAPPAARGDFDRLAQTAAADGTVRVIVRMDTPPAEAAPVLADQLDGYHHEIGTPHTKLPLVAASLSESAVRHLEDSPDVASVTRDEIRHVEDASSGPVIGSPTAIASGHNGNARRRRTAARGSGPALLPPPRPGRGGGCCRTGLKAMSGSGAAAPCSIAN